ncbi:MAG: hypothetical protein QOE57_3468 [Acidimicrobiaceae bacterium]|nr:hypothetical protein [Acidimicrobiaceae bacterium]
MTSWALDCPSVDGGDEARRMSGQCWSIRPRSILSPGGGGERPIVGVGVDAPQLGVGQGGQLRAVIETEQSQQPEHDVAVGAGVGDDHLGASPAVLAVDEVDHMQRVPRGSRDHLGGQPDGLVAD